MSEGPRSEAESRALADHLDACAGCRGLSEAWSQVQARLTGSQPIAPAAGFAARFQTALARRRSASARRQVALTLAATVAGALLTAFVLGGAVSANLAEAVAGLLKLVLAAARGLEVAVEVLSAGVSRLPEPSGALAGPGLVVSLGGLMMTVYAGLGALWAAAMFRILEPNFALGGDK